MTLICSKCGEEKPVTEFYKQRRGSRGYKYWCKGCGRVAGRKWRASDKGKAARRRSDRRLRKSKSYKAWRTHYRGSAERKLALATYARSKKGKATRVRYAGTEKGQASRARCKARRRIREKSAPNDLTATQWQKILAAHNYSCAYCGRKFSKDAPAERDHVIPVFAGGGLTRKNVVPACRFCNASKHANLVLVASG